MTPDRLVLDNLELVERLASKLFAQPAYQSLRHLREDLVAAGRLGLVQAASRFREGTGAAFSTFAYRRVHGAMLDELASMANVPRGAWRGGYRLARVSLKQAAHVPSRTIAPDAWVIACEQHRTLRRAVAALTVPQRRAFFRAWRGNRARGSSTTRVVRRLRDTMAA